jgi:hypothetical protein
MKNKEFKMKDDYTDIVFIVDRSGSMVQIKSDMEGGYKNFIKKQKKVKGICKVTLYSFDAQNRYDGLILEQQYKGRSIKTAPDMVLEPRGVTPLRDAIGTVINKTDARFKRMKKDNRPGRVLVVIITDGLENASKEFTADVIKEMIEKHEKKNKWNFVFLGANQDAVTTGASYGTHVNKSMTYAANNVGTACAFDSLDDAVKRVRTSSREDYEAVTSGKMGFFMDTDREAQAKAGA